MVARVEPPRGRSPRPEPVADTARYPGLTPEERAIPPEEGQRDILDEESPSPLWIAPVEVPQASRSVGFASAYPEALPDSLPPDPPPPEGLFDVPGLLERLWLARALETRRERPTTPPILRNPPSAGAPEPAPPPPTILSEATCAPPRAAVADDRPPSAVPPRIPLDERAAYPPPMAPTLPRSWICPGCYLTNDLAAPACAGCGRAAPRP
jgi:hypothetical protein